MREVENDEAQASSAKATLDALEAFSGTVTDVQAVFSSRPWVGEVNELKAWFRSGAGDMAPQDRADQTIDEIARVVETDVAQKLSVAYSQAVKAAGGSTESLESLEPQIEALSGVVESIRGLRGARWWERVDLKDETAEMVTEDLDAQLQPLSRKVQRIVEALPQKIESQRAEAEQLRSKAEVERADADASLQAALDEILPSWIRGLITVEQMVWLYPGVIVVLVVYVLILGLSASQHFRDMADGMGLDPSSRRDPVVSSLWTMTDRGEKHTVMTYGAYLLFAVSMWVLYELGTRALINAPSRPLPLGVSLPTLVWIGRLTFVAAIATIVRSAVRVRGFTAPENAAS